MQTMLSIEGGGLRRLLLPDVDEEVLPGIPWGRFDAVPSPAWWKGQAWQAEASGMYATTRLGRDLPEEVAACLLGGYGMPAEVGLAAFKRLQGEGFLCRRAGGATEIEGALLKPLETKLGLRRYRFPRQKARYLSGCLEAIIGCDEPSGDLDLRRFLETLPGLGSKTASWVVRNHRASDVVAILDVHVMRAGYSIGLFPEGATAARDYKELEISFLSFASALGIRAGLLDAIMWDRMRILSHIVERPRLAIGRGRQPRASDGSASHTRAGR